MVKTGHPVQVNWGTNQYVHFFLPNDLQYTPFIINRAIFGGQAAQFTQGSEKQVSYAARPLARQQDQHSVPCTCQRGHARSKKVYGQRLVFLREKNPF
ncbi:MAG TPA: hypothetical protein PLX29_02945 [Anaerolineaceae bacterium]|nr:hypothetical protein [Anaerolineaceae bacterium]